MSSQVTDSSTDTRSRVTAWALWDFGATGLNAIVITFVFAVYLTEQVGSGLPGATTPASWLGRVLMIAGLFVALLAPATGVWVDGPHRRRVALAVLTGVVVVADVGDEPDPGRLPLPVGGSGPAGMYRGVQRPGDCAV